VQGSRLLSRVLRLQQLHLPFVHHRRFMGSSKPMKRMMLVDRSTRRASIGEARAVGAKAAGSARSRSRMWCAGRR
jgi:hypothetical protein